MKIKKTIVVTSIVLFILISLLVFFFPKDCNISCCKSGFCKCFGIPLAKGEKENYHIVCIGYKVHPCCDECGGWVDWEGIGCNGQTTYCNKNTGNWTCDNPKDCSKDQTLSIVPPGTDVTRSYSITIPSTYCRFIESNDAN